MNGHVRALLELQAGVISRRRATAAGLTPAALRRLLRRRELAVLHPGVYVDHTGPPTWLQRAWAAVLLLWPAALWGPSALYIDDDEAIHVAVDRHRTRLVGRPGVVVHHVDGLADRVRWQSQPPRMHFEDAVLDAAALAEAHLDALTEVARAVRARRTTPRRLRDQLARRRRYRHRAWLASVLDDLVAGACSALEHSYLHRIERAHGLPHGNRQVRGRGRVGWIYRDCEYGEVVVELDGRLFHDNAAARDADFDRDLDAAADGKTTIRLTWGQVDVRSCATTARLVGVLRRHRVPCDPYPCSPGCPVK
jgi:hypothetical protein